MYEAFQIRSGSENIVIAVVFAFLSNLRLLLGVLTRSWILWRVGFLLGGGGGTARGLWGYRLRWHVDYAGVSGLNDKPGV